MRHAPPRLAAALAVALVALAGVATPSAALGPSAQGSQAVVLIHHPHDLVDPFGVPYPDPSSDTDTFSARHGAIAVEGRFDFPTFVADGVLPVSSLPDPNVPFASTLSNYTALVQARLATSPPGTLRLSGSVSGDSLDLQASFTPTAPLSDPQHPEALHLMAAVAEDFIHYEPDARVSNGVTEHRFTVRALADLGAADLGSGASVNRTSAFPVDAAWDRSHLIVAAWLEAGASFGRFRPGEVLQAAWAPADGATVTQSAKAVLVELYSATWCNPCLFGDLAAERLAVDYGGAPEAAKPEGPRYFQAPASPLAAVAAALAAGSLMWWTGRRRAP